MTSARFLLFFLVTGGVLGAMHLYLYRRLVHDVTPHPRLRRLGAGTLGVLALGAAGARPLAQLLPASETSPLVVGLLLWMGLVLYLFFFLVIGDVLGLLWRRSQRAAPTPPPSPERRALLARGLAAGATLAAGSTSALGTWRAFREPEVTEVPVRLPHLPAALEGFTLVQLSDVHVGAIIQERFLRQLVDTANRCKPDLVAITGDLVDGSVAELGRHVAHLQRLSSRHGTFFVTGNHDHYSGAAEWVAALQGLGWQVLRNRHVRIGDAGASFDLAGVDDYQSERFGGGRWDVGAALAGHRADRASVLLAHQPRGLEEVARHGVGLQLSGHTHGGQMFPGTLLGQLLWGPRNAGLSRVEDSLTQLYVSRGCGFVGPPMRVGAAPEVVKVVLLRA